MLGLGTVLTMFGLMATGREKDLIGTGVKVIGKLHQTDFTGLMAIGIKFKYLL